MGALGRFVRLFLGKTLAPFASAHAVNANEHKGYAEQLALVETYGVLHGKFPWLLHLFQELYRKTEHEYGGEAIAKVEAGAYALRTLEIDEHADDKQHQVGYGLVQLGRIARHGFVQLHKYKAHVGACVLAHNFGVHKIAQAYETGADGGGYGYVVEHTHKVYLGAAHIQPQGYHEAQCTTMRGKAGIAGKLPAAVGHLVHGQQHFERVAQEVAWLVKQAMAQTGTGQYAYEAVKKEGVELFGGYALALVELVHYNIGQRQTYAPAQRVPAHLDGT